MNISDDTLINLLDSGSKIDDYDIINIPCHIQSTERHIQIVSQVAQAVAMKKHREGIIAAKILSRKLRPKFDTKKDFIWMLFLPKSTL